MKKLRLVLTLIVGTAVVGLEFAYYRFFKGRESDTVALVAQDGSRPAATLEVFNAVPEFSLTDQNGTVVSRAGLKGKVWLATFIYTTCPSTCPMLTNRFADWQSVLVALGDVRFVSFSVDPEHDTPEVLKKYAERFKATDRWSFLTGDRGQIARIAKDGFMLAFAPGSETSGGRSSEIAHSTKIALVDRSGVVRRYYEGTGPDERERVLTDVKALLNEPVSMEPRTEKLLDGGSKTPTLSHGKSS